MVAIDSLLFYVRFVGAMLLSLLVVIHAFKMKMQVYALLLLLMMWEARYGHTYKQHEP